METMARCVNYNTAKPTKFSNVLHNGGPQASSTPAPNTVVSRTQIPVPKFTFDLENRCFHLKKHGPKFKSTMPPSPVKSAPPISRVFPYRKWAPEKAHAVSFRDGDNDSQLIDSAMCSRHYNSEKSELYFEQCFTIEKKLGEGSFGEVMKVKSQDNGKYYAVKRSREKFRNEGDRIRKLDEVKKHELLPKHKNCVEFVKAWEERYRLYIQTELCEMSLQEYAEKQTRIPESLLWKFLIDLLLGLQHIHKHGFIHLDLKPENIFISTDMTCKIGDFGLVVENRNIGDAREGDNKYMAPELLNSIFSTKADIFSLGIAILELATDIELPHEGLTWRLLRQGYLPPECSNIVSEELCAIIRLMLNPDPEKRPSVNELLKNPSISKRSRKLVYANLFNKILGWFCIILQFVAYMVWGVMSRPYVILKRACLNSQRSSKVKTIEDEDNMYRSTWKWDSSSSDLHSSSSGEGPRMGISLNGSERRSLIFTPDTRNRSKSQYTPTPRNSSPLNRGASHAPTMSPDLSPLSHSQHRFNRTNRSRLMGEAEYLDYSVTDCSDDEHTQESLMSSKPRNLLDLLNDVSDSDNSANSKVDENEEMLIKLPND